MDNEGRETLNKALDPLGKSIYLSTQKRICAYEADSSNVDDSLAALEGTRLPIVVVSEDSKAGREAICEDVRG